MRIGIDCDGVLYDFAGHITSFFREFLDDGNLPDPTTWNFFSEEWGMLPGVFWAGVRTAWAGGWVWDGHHGTLGDRWEPRRSLGELSDKGHEIVVVTTRPDYARESTQEWLAWNQLPHNELIFTEDKTKWNLDVLLDDAPHNIEQAQAAGIRAIIWDQPWNRHVEGERVYAWDQFVNAINEGPMDPAYWGGAEVVVDPNCPTGTLGFTLNKEHVELPSEWTVTDPETGGMKGQKPARMELLPYDVLAKVAEHYGRGAEKYDARNWEKGYAYSLSMGALMRHLSAWWQGEDIDAETGSSHLYAVIFHAFSLAAFELRGIGTDDRPVGLRSTDV